MRSPMKEALVTAALLYASAPTGRAQVSPRSPTKTAHVVPNFVSVTDQVIRAPKPADWLIHRGNYQAWRRARVSRQYLI